MIGSGPNGLAAAVALAEVGASVLVVEARDEVGGGTRVAELTLPGFVHDVCSAVHPMGILSPYLRELPLTSHGLEWICPPASVAHPMPNGRAVILSRSLDDTAAGLDLDARAYRRMLEPFLGNPHGLLADLLAPLRLPRHPIAMARFGWLAIRSAEGLAKARFRGERARALFAGCAAHSILPLDRPLTSAIGLIFSLTGHVDNWPVARGGSIAITRALASYLTSLGGKIELGVRVKSLDALPRAKAILFDTSPEQPQCGEAITPSAHF